VTAALIFGCAGQTLQASEATFFRDVDPWGFILFARNIASPDQVRRLTAALREAVGRADAPILIDQEGGRVARLRPPHWRRYPAGHAFAMLEAAEPGRGGEMAKLGARLIAADLRALGVTVDCAPVLDVPTAGAHDIIGDRAYGENPAMVIALGRAVAEGLLAGGVLPIVKHIPGHGRAGADSHLSLPVVDATLNELKDWDFAPFKALSQLPLAMTAHVVYAAVDPASPATTSATVIADVIRGHIGFDGLLISDDVSMQALTGDLGARTAAALAAGCDLALHCNGDAAEMALVAGAAGPLGAEAARRAGAALARIASTPEAFDAAAARQRFDMAFDDRFAA
jgi:beta-N-acetylhexosaminidase